MFGSAAHPNNCELTGPWISGLHMAYLFVVYFFVQFKTLTGRCMSFVCMYIYQHIVLTASTTAGWSVELLRENVQYVR